MTTLVTHYFDVDKFAFFYKQGTIIVSIYIIYCRIVFVFALLILSLFLSYRFYVTLFMLAWVGRLLPYSDQVASHSNHTPRAALSFSSNNSFSRFKDDMKWLQLFMGMIDAKVLLDRMPFLAPTLLWD